LPAKSATLSPESLAPVVAVPPAKSATSPTASDTAAPVVAAPEVVPAAEAPAPVVEAPPLTPDQKVAEKIHELLGTKADRILDRRYKAAVEGFYSARAYAPLWIEDGVESRRAKAAASYLAGVMPMVSTRPTTRCRRFATTIRRRWQRPNSNSRLLS
jgi:hypothetical protein